MKNELPNYNKKVGGYVVFNKDGKTAITNDGTKGGYFYGDSHQDPSNGISAIVDNDRPILVEGNEVIINKKTVQSEKVLTVKGTPKEILSTLNQMDGNGVAIGDEEAEILAKYRTGGSISNKYHLGGDMSKHLAPNGKPSNLTHEQWHLVRTPEFKAWFGDWENEPANSSKVVDENGEPLVVYHGTKKEFTIFGEGKNKSILPEYKDEYLYKEKTNYFHKSKKYAKTFGSKYGGYEKSYFLNIKNIEKVDEDTIEDIGYFKSIYDYYVISEGFDGIFSESGQYATLLSPNQIKLADGSNKTFDGGNDDIRFAKGGGVNDNFNLWFKDSKVVNKNGEPLIVYHGTPNKSFSKFSLEKAGSNSDLGMYGKGFYFSNDYDYSKTYTKGDGDVLELYLSIQNPYFIRKKEDIPYIKVPMETIEDLENSEIAYSEGFRKYLIDNGHDGVIIERFNDSNEYVALYPNQIKLADGSNTTFDENNDDIRFKTGGSISRMTPSELKAFYNSKEGKKLDAQTYSEWNKLVNMTKSELEKFYNSVEGKKAGLTTSQAKEQGIDSGRESARWIIKMKDIPYTQWSSDMWRWAKKQINFIKRMSGMKGSLYNDKGEKTRKHTALLIWGHNPEQKFAGGGEISKNVDNKLKELGFEFNKFNYRYGKKINEQDYITAFYSEKENLYKIRGNHKFTTPLGENSVGIQFDFNNEKEFYNKIQEYLSKSINNPEQKFKGGGDVKGYDNFKNPILINGFISNKKIDGKEIFLITYNSGGQEGLNVHQTMNPLAMLDAVEKKTGLHTNTLQVFIYEHTENSNRIETEDELEFLKDNYTVIIVDRDSVEFYNGLKRFKGGGELSKKALAVETNDLTDFVRKYFIKDGRIDVADAMQELFGNRRGKSIADEYRKRIGLHKKGGLTISQLAHNLWEQHKDEVREGIDDSDFRNAVEEVLISEYGVSSMIKSLIEKSGESEQDKENEFWMNQFDEGDDEYYEDLSDEEVADYFKDMEGFERELAKGTEHEMEHLETLKKVAEGKLTPEEAVVETASKHLEENPRYYEDLAKMEKEHEDIVDLYDFYTQGYENTAYQFGYIPDFNGAKSIEAYSLGSIDGRDRKTEKKSIDELEKALKHEQNVTEQEESIPDLIEGLKVLADSLEGAEKKEIEDVIEGLEILLESEDKFARGGEFRMATGGKIVFKPITTPL